MWSRLTSTSLGRPPDHGRIHLTDSLGVEFETNLHRR
ncbi:hypothetical protein STIAU_8258 [Stigmatella aurantiaca DW4/3-1]|uniref:Uncharacterized protein n=1 Tax=Stigmatella aurantiaca (strain DW4/3-1) TaxID=378806 RepID=Q090S0_STIAD|nr:hypothetical protein STIAU_8258 [Stigmatella aurantiaca DW4/3-1]